MIAVVIGEGGSGGALAIGVADKLAMMRNSVFSVTGGWSEDEHVGQRDGADGGCDGD